jgi:hypothetical protein
MQFSALKLFLMLENCLAHAAELGIGKCCGVSVWGVEIEDGGDFGIVACECIWGSRFLDNRMDRFF